MNQDQLDAIKRMVDSEAVPELISRVHARLFEAFRHAESLFDRENTSAECNVLARVDAEFTAVMNELLETGNE